MQHRVRYPTSLLGQPLTERERTIAELLASGKHNYDSIAGRLCLGVASVRANALRAAKKIGGALPTQFRLVVWWRQTNGLDLLTGKALERG